MKDTAKKVQGGLSFLNRIAVPTEEEDQDEFQQEIRPSQAKSPMVTRTNSFIKRISQQNVHAGRESTHHVSVRESFINRVSHCQVIKSTHTPRATMTMKLTRPSKLRRAFFSFFFENFKYQIRTENVSSFSHCTLTVGCLSSMNATLSRRLILK